MRPIIQAIAISAVTLAVAACGGGGEQARDVPALAVPQAVVVDTAALNPLRAAPPAAAPVPSVTELMNWAQRQYPQYFPGAQDNKLYENFTYRFFPGTGNYLGVADGNVYILGPVSGGALTMVGSLAGFGCNVFPDSCSSVPAALQGIPQSSIVLNASTTLAYARLSADTTSLQVAYKPGEGAELQLNTNGQKIQLLVDAVKKSAVYKDPDSNTKTIYESGPKGTLVRVYTMADVFIEGFWIENRVLYKLKANGTTEPGNLVFVKNLPPKAARPQAAALAPQATDGSCGQLLQEYTGSAQEYMEETGESLEESGNSSAKRVSGVTKVWLMLVRSFCGRGQASGYSDEEQRALNLQLLKSMGGKKVGEIIDRGQSWQQTYNELVAAAKQVADGLSKLPASVRDSYRASDVIKQPTPSQDFQPSPAAAVSQQKANITPTRVYTGATLGCAAVSQGSTGWLLQNSCGDAIRVGYCTGTSTSCSFTSFASLLRGESRTIAYGGARAFVYGACPAFYASQPVTVADNGGNTYYCYYLSN